MKYLWLVIALVAVGAGVTAYVLNSKNNSTNSDNTAESNTPAAESSENPVANQDQKDSQTGSGLALTGTNITGNYYQYEKSDYEAAKAADRPIFLFFYANWCPTCAEQEPVTRSLMQSLANEAGYSQLIAFRVNFNDSDTDKDEQALAKEFGVTYQHTMFVLNKDGQQVKKLLGQTSAEALKSAFAGVI